MSDGYVLVMYIAIVWSCVGVLVVFLDDEEDFK